MLNSVRMLGTISTFGVLGATGPPANHGFAAERAVDAAMSRVAVHRLDDAPRDVTPRAATCMPADQCCKICSKGKACRNTCIRRTYDCHKGRGCACDADEVCKDIGHAWLTSRVERSFATASSTRSQW